MRVFPAIAMLAATLGATAAEAGEWVYVERAPVYAVRTPRPIVYDSMSGSGNRAYWAAPWQGRHYYPFTGKKPKVGRHENLNAPSHPVRPAPTYYQEWSTNALYPPRVIMPPADVAPTASILPPK